MGNYFLSLHSYKRITSISNMCMYRDKEMLFDFSNENVTNHSLVESPFLSFHLTIGDFQKSILLGW